MDGSSLLGFFQLSVIVLPVMDSMTGAPSGGSGRMSKTAKVSVRIFIWCQRSLSLFFTHAHICFSLKINCSIALNSLACVKKKTKTEISCGYMTLGASN